MGHSSVQQNLNGFVLTKHLHRTSAPYKSSTNGQAERVVQILKSAIKQAQATQTDVSAVIAKYLLVYRNTPHSTTGERPSLLLMGRRLHTRLDLLTPSVEKHVQARQYTTMISCTAKRVRASSMKVILS